MNRRDFLFTASALATSAGNLLTPERQLLAASKADHTVHIGPASIELANGQTIKTTGYDGMIPGPLLRVKEGKQVTVDIYNDLDKPEFLHWHGMFIPVAVDGAEEEGSPVLPPRSHKRISFTPKPAGTRWYHTHSMAMTDLERGAYNGQYGIVYVEPKNESGAFDTEIFLAAHHWEPSIVHRSPPDIPWNVDYKSASINGYVNGKPIATREPIRVKQGQRVMFRVVNADASRALNLALAGHKFRVVAMDGNPVPTPREEDALTIQVAERIDAVVEMNHPGKWILGAPRDQEREIGMRVVVEYESATGEPKWVAPPQSPFDLTTFGSQLAHSEPDGKFEVKFMMVADEGKPFNRWMINDQFWPDVEPLKVQAGKRYRVLFKNGMEDGHPVHIHRHNFELVSINGKTTSGLIKDTFNVPRNGSAEADFVANNPGNSLLHCHMQHHMDYGFKILAKYT